MKRGKENTAATSTCPDDGRLLSLETNVTRLWDFVNVIAAVVTDLPGILRIDAEKVVSVAHDFGNRETNLEELRLLLSIVLESGQEIAQDRAGESDRPTAASESDETIYGARYLEEKLEVLQQQIFGLKFASAATAGFAASILGADRARVSECVNRTYELLRPLGIAGDPTDAERVERVVAALCTSASDQV